jgi:hypothetical protein
MPIISAPVGRGGTNRLPDVQVVQQFLNQNIAKLTPLQPVQVSGIADAQTIAAIEEFQRREVRMLRPTGRVDPGDKTLNLLTEEVVPIVDYIVDEMNRNAASADVRKMKEFNSYSLTKCIEDYRKLPLLLQFFILPQLFIKGTQSLSYKGVALLTWAWLVRQDGPWDHKPYIRSTFHPRHPVEQVWHIHHGYLYFYDIWSNIHYGYVGAAAGFTTSELLDGAGLEQIGSDLLRSRLPRSSVGVEGLRRFDDPSDRTAIAIGIKLFQTSPRGVTREEVLQAVEASPTLEKKPYK